MYKNLLDENIIVELVRREMITDTFRRLSPEKKNLIYRTAVRLFGKYGYDGLAVDQLCREAGISKGSFFQYFPSKSHLLEFTILVFDDYLTRWMDELRKNEHAVLVRERLLYLYNALIAKPFKNEEMFYLFVTNAMNHSGVELEGINLERHFNSYITEIINRGEETGEIRGDLEVEITSHLTSLIISALVERQYSGSQVPSRQLGDYLISFLFDGIKV